jgi:hypothetical protein
MAVRRLYSEASKPYYRLTCKNSILTQSKPHTAKSAFEFTTTTRIIHIRETVKPCLRCRFEGLKLTFPKHTRSGHDQFQTA